MNPTDHENYAKKILESLFQVRLDANSLNFEPVRGQSRNAAKAMKEILLHRISEESRQTPTHLERANYQWNNGIFNCRNISDRRNFWTNIRRDVAKELHEFAAEKAVAYLLAFSDPTTTDLSVWVVPEPLLDAWLSSQQPDKGYPLQIFPEKQRIHKWAESPDLSPYFRVFPLSLHELRILKEAREVDSLAKDEDKIARLDNPPGIVEGDEQSEANSIKEPDSQRLLNQISQQLNDLGYFDPSEITDSRDRVLSSIVKRMGQPAFRKKLLAAYNGRCAITECDVKAVLDAAHIIPYRGEETNRPENGLLLRTDMHTLFDLKLIAVDVTAMRLLVSNALDGTYYEEFRGKAINLPDALSTRPSREALEDHRKESGL